MAETDLTQSTSGALEPSAGPPPRPPMPDHYRASFYWPQLLKDNPGLGVSLAYALLTLAGAFYAGFFYFILKVRFLQLTDASDFLVMIFQHPLVPLLLLLPFPFFSLYMAISYRLMWWARWRFPRAFGKLPDPSAPPKYGQRVQRILGYSFFALYAIAGLEFYALGSAMRVRDGKGQKVVLEIRPSARSESMSFSSKEVILLGTTTRFTIVYDPEEGRAWSLPHDSIARILHPARKKKDGKEGMVEPEATAEVVEEVKQAVENETAPTDGPRS